MGLPRRLSPGISMDFGQLHPTCCCCNRRSRILRFEKVVVYKNAVSWALFSLYQTKRWVQAEKQQQIHCLKCRSPCLDLP